MTEAYLLTLPWPPSVNDYWLPAKRTVKAGKSAGKVYISKRLGPEAIAFRATVVEHTRRGHRPPPRLTGRLSIFVMARPPRLNRTRDLDNIWKSLLDALQFAEVVLNDSQFDEIRMIRWNPEDDGNVTLAISRFFPAAALGGAREAGIPFLEEALFP